MSGRGKAFAVVSILTLVFGIIAGVLPAQAQDKSTGPPANQVINHPSFPLRGGPYMYGVTYDRFNERIVIVFNEDVVDPAGTPAHELFESDTFILYVPEDPPDPEIVKTVVVGPFPNVWYIEDITIADGFTNNGLERIRLVGPSVVEDLDGKFSNDMSWYTVATGPIPVKIELEGFEDDDFNNQAIVITWNDLASMSPGFDLIDAFGATPEFNGVEVGNLTLGGDGTADWTITNDGFGESFLRMFGGITKLHIAGSAVRYNRAAPNNSANDRWYKWTFQNRGPYPVAAYYVDAGNPGSYEDDQIYVVFSEPVVLAGDHLGLGAAKCFLPVGAYSATGGSVALAFPGTFTSSVLITGLSDAGGFFEPVAADGSDLLRYVFTGGDPSEHTQTIQDFLERSLHDEGLAAHVDVPLLLGPGIIRASYDDGQTPGPANDVIVLWFSEPLHSDLEAEGAVTVDHFHTGDQWGFGTDPVITVTANVNNLGRIRIRDFTGSTRLPPPGAWIQIQDPGDLLDPIRNVGGVAANEDILTVIIDESRPYRVNLAEMSPPEDVWHEDYEGSGVNIDEVTLSWQELIAYDDDGDQFFLFIKKNTTADLTNFWMHTNLDRAIPLGNRRPELTGDTHTAHLLIRPHGQVLGAIDGEILKTTDDDDIFEGDHLFFVVAATDWTGNVQHITQPDNPALLFSTSIYVGGMCAPVDFYSDIPFDGQDLIHVIGTPDADDPDVIQYQVFGDAGAVPCAADSVRAYYVATPGVNDDTDGLPLGTGPVNADGSFPPFDIDVSLMPDPQDVPQANMIYLSAVRGDDETARWRADHGMRWCEILLDRYFPEVEAHHVFDPWNPYQIYKAGDHINIRLLLDDRIADYGNGTTGRNSLAHVVADFSLIDSVATNHPDFGAPPSEIVMVSMGADMVDNNNNWDPDLHDIGYYVSDDLSNWDGWRFTAGTRIGYDNDVPDFGDPYIDENGNGQWDPGETFWHVQDRGVNTGLFHLGEPMLDANDPDEHGWYEVRSTVVADRGTIRQGYPLDPDRIRSLAYLDPFSLVRFTIQDNALDPAIWNDTAARWPAGRPDTDYRSLGHVTVLDGTDPEQRFLAKIDTHAPTVSKITELFRGDSPNLIQPGDPVYQLGQVVDLTVETPSDDDVIMAQLQLSKDGGTTWEPLALDPLGDANPELPDMDDPLVAAIVERASTTPAMDPALNCENDFRDNNNNAYFTYDIFQQWNVTEVGPGIWTEPGGRPAPTDPTGGYGTITWWNIDEPAECAGAGNTNVNRYIPSRDDSGDGIMDGEAVALETGPGTNMRLVRYQDDPVNPTYIDPEARTIYVAAAKVLGLRETLSAASNVELAKFYANGIPYTDVVPAGHSIMTYSERLFGDEGYTTRLAPDDRLDALTSNSFNWRDTHDAAFIDMELMALLYGLDGSGDTEYMFRAVTWDVAGNSNEEWAQPITFTLHLDSPIANLEGCGDTDLPADSDFVDVNPETDIIEIYDAGTHPDSYTLRVASDSVSDNVVSVTFWVRQQNFFTGDWGDWEVLGSDDSAPYTMQWPEDGMFTLNNYPANRHETYQFHATALDIFGNTTDADDLCVFEVRVIDGTAPASWIRGIYRDDLAAYYDDDDFNFEGIQQIVPVPVDPSVNIWIRIEDMDRDDLRTDEFPHGRLTTLLPGKSSHPDIEDPFTTGWCPGIDMAPGDAGVDGGVLDLTTRGGIFTLGLDDPGPDFIPGTEEDDWNGTVANNTFGITDDYITNDIKYVRVEYRRVNPPTEWTEFASVHGDAGADGHVYDYTLPVVVTLNTQHLADTYGEGLFELRAWACDVEGNCNREEAPIATIALRSEPLRAYIQPPVCETATVFDLYAVHYIHDYEIDKVRFEYQAADADLCAADPDAWTLIAIDDVTTGRGDAVLYLPPADVAGRVDIQDLVFAASLDPGDPDNVATGEYWFYDADGDGYSPRDPIVQVQHDGGTTYQEGTDIWVLGDGSLLADGVTLTPFADDEFYAAADDADPLSPETWIFRENALTGINGDLDLWMITWDATGLPDGNYLVRAIAIDAQNNMDQIAYTCYNPAQQNPVEIELVQINPALASAELTTLTLDVRDEDGDNIVLDLTDPDVIYVPGNAKWARVEATSEDAINLHFEYSLNGGMDWHRIQVNPDQEWYADLDGVAGFQDAPAGEGDAIVVDVNGDYVFNAAHDFIVKSGWCDIPEGWPLMPLVENVDPVALDDAYAHKNGTTFYAYLRMADLPLDFFTDVNVLLQAVPHDMACGEPREGTASAFAAVIFGENQTPEADVIRVVDLDGNELDVYPPIHDGDGVVTLGGDIDAIRVFVTAQDMGTLDRVELWYRLRPGCHEVTGVEDLQYHLMPWTEPDSTYPYQFLVDVSDIPDGNYQFYPRAYDQSGNFNAPPENPWGFQKFSLAGEDFAYVSIPEVPGDDGERMEVVVGDELVLHAMLRDMDLAPTTAVRFWFAPRILGELIDPALVHPITLESEDLKEPVLGADSGDGIELTVNGEAATYHDDLEDVVSPTKLDYTVSEAGERIIFGARPDVDDVILISYNFSDWYPVNGEDGNWDVWYPYTAAWAFADGGVPDPSDVVPGLADDTHVGAYDLIAVAYFDVNGDGIYPDPAEPTDCDYHEPLMSEGNYILLRYVERPLLMVYGLNWSDNDEHDPGSPVYPDWNWPGNPLFRSGDNLGGPNYEAKLSGIETDIFVVAMSESGAAIDAVTIEITAQGEDAVVYEWPDGDITHFSLASNAEFIDIPVTFYEDDYPQWLPHWMDDPADPDNDQLKVIENVILRVENAGGSADFQMVHDPVNHAWSATGRFSVDYTNTYEFIVDLRGNQQDAIADPRNQDSGGVSEISVPELPFWHLNIDNIADLANNKVLRALVTVSDAEGNVGTNLISYMPDSDPEEVQGPIVFIHDRTPPVVHEIFITNMYNQPLAGNRISPEVSYRLWATINDAPFDDINVMSTTAALFQFSPNEGRDWIDLDWDNSPEEGWFVDFSPLDPRDNGYNNTPIAEYWFRVIAVDDGHNHGYSDRQDPAVVLPLIVDAAQPHAEIIRPVDGQLLPLDEVAYLETSVEGDWLPALQGDDIAKVLFQVKFNRFFWVKDDPTDPEEYFTNGYHDVWAEDDPGAPTENREYWFDLDATPFDNSDKPYLTEPNFGDNYLIEWIPAGWDFIRRDNLWAGDEYARIRVMAEDTAGNRNTHEGLPDPPEVLVILSDETVTRAYITHVDERAVNPGVELPVQALEPVQIDGSLQLAGDEVAHVKVYAYHGPDSATLLAIDHEPNGDFQVHWDATGELHDSLHHLFATVVDIDGNESDWEEATKVRVRIDRMAPVVNYTPIQPGYAGFIAREGLDDGEGRCGHGVLYHDDGIVDHTSWVIVPDMHTGDVQFAVTTEDDDVKSMELQWRRATDLAGVWRPLSELFVGADGVMTYQPNRNFDGNHYWWLHVEDFAIALEQGGRMQFRALATDLAGNKNNLQADFAEFTTDNTKPRVWTWDDDIAEDGNRLAAGESVLFTIAMQDGQPDDDYRTDIVHVELHARIAPSPSLPEGGPWLLQGQKALNHEDHCHDLDSGNAMWVAAFTWDAPAYVTRNTPYEFKLVMSDAAGNTTDTAWDVGYEYPKEVEVIDIHAPERSKVVDILAQVWWAAPPDPFNPNEDSCDWKAWFDADGEGEYRVGTSWLLHAGADHQPPAPGTGGVEVGDADATWPRRVTEGYLNTSGNSVKVARTVTIVGRTQGGDDGYGQPDDGVAWVEFLLQPLDANDNPVGDPYILGADECRPGFPLYYWLWTWDTTKYDDGRYRLGVYARDEAGNVEDINTLDWTNAVIEIDNLAPTAQMDADPWTDTVVKTVTVERNEPFTLFARTLVPGSDDLENYEMNSVEFMYKRARDLNLEGSWGSVPVVAGATWPEIPEDGNPDHTRPYSFDVHMGRLHEPTDDQTDVPLSVGEAYDFCIAVWDEVGNETSVVESYSDSLVAGVGSRHIRVLIQDTIAPHLEFTALRRQLPGDGSMGDGDPVINPTRVHAQGFEYIEAKLKTRDLDMAYAEFVYRKHGETAWNLIDAPQHPLDADDDVDRFTWRVGPWDLRTLEHGEWYEVAVIGVDDVGNADADPDIIHVYVDYEAPHFTMISPSPESSSWCNGIMDLVIAVEDRGASDTIGGMPWREHDDVYDVRWYWKHTEDVDDPIKWEQVPGEWRHDFSTGRYSNTVDLDDLDSGLYDLRVVMIDKAGNTRTEDVHRNLVDRDEPEYVWVSNIKMDGLDDTTPVVWTPDMDPDTLTDITGGTTIEVWGTAWDNDTDIVSLQFEVARSVDPDNLLSGPPPAGDPRWHDLGLTIDLADVDHDDLTARTGKVYWNTTGLIEGVYFLKVHATDECYNVGESDVVAVRVYDRTPPIARIMGWDADLQPHGHNPPSWITIYALAECDRDMNYDVQFQYALHDADEPVPTGPWFNLGIGEMVDIEDDGFTTGQFWYTTIQPVEIGPAEGDHIWLRALVKDEHGNRYGDESGEEVPTVLVELVAYDHDRPCRDEDHPDYPFEDGMITFRQVRSEDMDNVEQMIESVSVMVESRDNLILTVRMTDRTHAPRAFLYWEPSQPTAYPTPANNVRDYSPGVRTDNSRGLERSVDDPKVWRCRIDTAYLTGCDHYAFWVTALVDGGEDKPVWIDMADAYFREYTVTAGLGTNGTVWLEGYDGLCASVMVPSGAILGADCLLISPTTPPLVSVDQMRYIDPVPNTAYHIAMREDGFATGYQARVTIAYPPEYENQTLTVRRWDWDSGRWVGAGLSHIRDSGSEVEFRVDGFGATAIDDLGFAKDMPDTSASYMYYGQIFQLFEPRGDAPIVVSNIWPHSPYVNEWWTDADPVIVVYLRDQGGQVIDASRVELLIDGDYWATWYSWDPSDPDEHANWIRGNGRAILRQASFDETVYELVYHHSTYPRDWLRDGEHVLTVRYKPLTGSGTDEWISNDIVFHVDRTAPYIEFDGGFVSNPDLRNVHGYMNPTTGQLVARIYDGGIGVLFKHDRPWYFLDFNCDGVLSPFERQFDPVPYPDIHWYPGYWPGGPGVPEYPWDYHDPCWIRVDWGMKYDLWLIQPDENDQRDIDEIEERILIHTGTANQLEPWLMRTYWDHVEDELVVNERMTLDQYNPATDTLVVPIPVMGGGLITDGDMLEITWYSEKTIEANSDGPGWGCAVDTVVVNGQSYLIYAHGCTYDSESQEMHIYEEGIMDWAGNTGSKYVEQRFMVDMSGPVIRLLSPAGRIEPSGNMKIEVLASDFGSGVADVHVTVTDPEGKEVLFDPPLAYSNGKVTGELEGPLMNGDYKIHIVGRDMLGNVTEVVETVRVQAAVLTMSEPKAFPNPFNPGSGQDANIRFDISKPSQVTAKVYDWAGQYVTTLVSNETWEPGENGLKWSGQAADGTNLANGAYMCRITAKDLDTGRTRESTLKIVIWRE